jgi:hypothetical protein
LARLQVLWHLRAIEQVMRDDDLGRFCGRNPGIKHFDNGPGKGAADDLGSDEGRH